MAGIESIISGILIGMVIIAGSGMIIYSQAKSSIERIEQEQLFFSYDTYSNNVDSFLQLTDNESQKALGTLVSYSIYRRDEMLTVKEDDPQTPEDDSVVINVSEKLEIGLDRLFGQGNYYLNITPRTYDVSLSFIIDGSYSFREEIKELADRMEEIVDIANGVSDERDVIVFVYIMSEGDHTIECQPFLNLVLGDTQLECIVLQAEPTSMDAINIYIAPDTPVYSYKREHDIRPPFRVPHYDQPGKEWTERQPAYYYETDWAAGTAFASNRAKMMGISRISLLFPMAGELSSGSINDTCYTKNISWNWDPWDRHFCDYCTLSCDDDPDNLLPAEARSLEIVEKAIQVAIDNNHIINPILAYRCNFFSPRAESDPLERQRLSDQWVAWNEWYYAKYGKQLPNDPYHTFCSDIDCGACTADHPTLFTDGTYNTVCFHYDCLFELERQMQMMADQTGGVRGNLNEVAQLLLTIGDAIEQNLEPFRIEIGEPEMRREQFVYTRKIPLPVGNEFVDLKLHVYIDQ